MKKGNNIRRNLILVVVGILFLIIGTVFVLAQQFLAEKIYPEIPVVNLCYISFGRGVVVDSLRDNRDSCFAQRFYAQHDWQQCLAMGENERVSCMITMSQYANQDFCDHLQNTKEISDCRIVLESQ
jgi:hypothetical protein